MWRKPPMVYELIEPSSQTVRKINERVAKFAPEGTNECARP
jgi:hypothetical protein